ncbi:MAG TPA: long-chain fatty acid--CoA ligase [Herpetosiphonaceae bacterium]
MEPAKPWLAAYDPGVPAEIAIPPLALPDVLRETASRLPDATALLFYGREISYRELDEAVERFAVGLVRQGVGPGERVVLMLPNTPQSVIGFYGVLRAGALVVVSNPLFTSEELVHQINDSQAGTLIGLSLFAPSIFAARAASGLRRVILTNFKEYLPPLRRRLFTWARQEREGHLVPPEQARTVTWWSHLMEESGDSGGAAALPQLDPAGRAAILYTGGTTGEPKGTILSHRALVANALQVRAWLPRPRPAQERILAALPFSHAYGLTSCMNLAVADGAALVLLPSLDTRELIEAVREYQPTIFPGIPALYAELTELARGNDSALRSLRDCVSGAAPLPIEVQEGFERVTRAKLVEGYGLTEAGPVTHACPFGSAHRSGTIGVPFPSTEAKIVDLETGADLPPGSEGELLVRGPQLMEGYWNRPEETAAALTADGWLHTGDIAQMDEHGFFQVIARRKELIMAGPYNVYPRDVEEVLYEHPQVLDAAVAGTPGPDGLEEITAFVVLRPGSSASESELIAFCRKRLSTYKLPQRVIFRTALPRSFIGKILRRKLIDEFLRP